MKSAKYAHYYVCNILYQRWKKGEQSIMKDAEYAYYYCFAIIRGRWKEAIQLAE